jgi:hypothetical protein
VSDMICGKVHFNAILTKQALWEAHNASAIDNDINHGNVGPGKKIRGCCPDGFLAGKIDDERTIVYGRVLGFKYFDALVDLGRCPASNDQMRRRL